MRNEKLLTVLRLARRLAGTAEGLTLDEMASEFGVNRRTAERMRDAIRELFPQMEEGRGEGRSKRFRIPGGGLDGFYQSPTVDELAELAAAIKALEQTGGIERAALLQSLADKIRSALRSAVKRRIDPDLEALLGGEALVVPAGPRPMANPKALARLREALKSSRVCIFDYASADGGYNYRRYVTPYGIMFGRAYYLVGPEAGKTEPFLWRLDRMGEIELGEYVDGAPADFNLNEFVNRSFGTFKETPEDVVLRFRPSAAADAKRFQFHPHQTLEDQDDGSVLVSFRAGGIKEMVDHLVSWSDAVEIIAPQALRDKMIAQLQQTLDHHRASRARSFEAV